MQGYINDDNDRLLLFTIVIIMTSLFTALYLLRMIVILLCSYVKPYKMYQMYYV